MASTNRPGDGEALPQIRWWQVLTRSTLAVTLPEPASRTSTREAQTFAIHVDFLGEREEVALYTDGRQSAVADLPARFPVPTGHLEVAISLYGFTRAHLVRDDGTERAMTPLRPSAEYWRAVLAARHPRLSRALGAAAVVILLTGLTLAIPQALEVITSVDLVAETLGTFTSPWHVPGWLASTMLVLGVLAAIERALTLRNHWLIDADTWIFDD